MNNYSTYLDEAKKWLNNPNLDEEIRNELENVLEPLKAFFYAPLEFGTAGLRGLMRPGINSMNVHVIMQATQGLANLIADENGKERGVAISYDSRNNSKKFAIKAAEVLAAAGIKVYFYSELHPVPTLSFAVRELKTIAGIMITASHNPKEYNGYKVYWEDGAQLPPKHASKVSEYIQSLDIFNDIKQMDFDEACKKGIITVIENDFDEKYIAEVLKQQANPNAVKQVANDFKLVYTPIHGSGYRLVPEVLRRIGVKAENIITVPEQMILDGNFPTVEKPNPEFKSSFNLAVELAKKEDCDLIVGTDPDADRMGIMIRTPEKEYITITGNQAAALMINYILKNRKEQNTLPKNPYAVTSIVSTNICEKICQKYGATMYSVFTGFKFIGEKIKEMGDEGFVFGFEESYGYLAGTYARDKDAVYAAMIITEMAAYYKSLNMTLYDALNELYKEFGYCLDVTATIRKEGVTANEDMKKAMANIRENLPKQIAGTNILKVRDYKLNIITDMKTGKTEPTPIKDSNVLYFEMEDGAALKVRPSGTEPLIKLYFSIPEKDEKSANQKLEIYKDALTKML